MKPKKIKITLNKKKYNLGESDNIIDIYLFGSVARKENDEFSDLDIFVLCLRKEKLLQEKLAKKLKIKKEWISIYSLEEIVEMRKMGSLFLWHLKKEGKKLYSNNNSLKKIFKILPNYKKIYVNLQEYKEILTDIKKSILREELSDYEINLIAILLRNISIIHCYMRGHFLFGRNSAFQKSQLFRESKKRIDMNIYLQIYKYRQKYKDGLKIQLEKINVKEIVLQLKEYLEDVINEYQNRRCIKND